MKASIIEKRVQENTELRVPLAAVLEFVCTPEQLELMRGATVSVWEDTRDGVEELVLTFGQGFTYELQPGSPMDWRRKPETPPIKCATNKDVAELREKLEALANKPSRTE